MRWRLRNNVDGVKRISPGVFPFLRNHNRRAPFQCRDLPVDMQHLRLEKCRAITGDDGAGLGRWNSQRPRLNAQRSMFNFALHRRPRARTRNRSLLGLPFEKEGDDEQSKNENESELKSKIARALLPAHEQDDRFSHRSDTRASELLKVADRCCSAGFP